MPEKTRILFFFLYEKTLEKISYGMTWHKKTPFVCTFFNTKKDEHNTKDVLCTIAKIDPIFLAPNFSFHFLNRISIAVSRISLDLSPKIGPYGSGAIYQASIVQSVPETPRSKLALIKEDSCSCTTSSGVSSENKIEDFPLGKFMRFLKHLKLKKLLPKISDSRDPKKTEYTVEIILIWVLCIEGKTTSRTGISQ
jgi:hypothetical protein